MAFCKKRMSFMMILSYKLEIRIPGVELGWALYGMRSCAMEIPASNIDVQRRTPKMFCTQRSTGL